MAFVDHPGAVCEGVQTVRPVRRPTPKMRFEWLSCRRYLFITIMLGLWMDEPVPGQQMTSQALPGASSSNVLPDAPLQDQEARYPTAVVVPPPDGAVPVTIESATQSYHDGVYDLDGAVVITYEDRVLRADHVMYDSKSGDVVATGHLVLTGGTNQERIVATHGTYNLRTATGRFYEVQGSVAMKPRVSHAPAVIPADPTYANAGRDVYSNGNPFLFQGRIVVKTGERSYDVYDGSVTSCQLPKPDWLLSGAHFAMDGEMARATDSTFHLLGYPVFFLPYVTHPTDSEARQSGFLIPDVGESSTKGFIVGEQIYMTLGRSADLTVGADYYSSRGFAQAATFRYRGQGLDFVNMHYSGLLDRGYTPAGGVYTNQGGEDVVFAGRRDFTATTRAAANVEYLSSYIYREAFTDNFNLAVTSDVVSTGFVAHEAAGYEWAGLAERYQGIKVIASTNARGVTTPQQEVHLFHAPELSFASTDHRLGSSGLEYTLEGTFAGLQRSQPNFSTGGIVERLDFRPQIAYPFSIHEWRFRPSIGARETLYTRSRRTPYPPGSPPIEERAGLSRSDFEGSFEVRPPVIERTFETKGWARVLGDEVRHTVEPEVTYRYVGGISNFASILRFDETDVASDTNELEYGVTQRLFRRASLFHKDGTPKPCKQEELPNGPGLEPEAASDAVDEALDENTPSKGCGNEELISWRLTQKYFFDPGFGGAIINGRRDIFETTLDLSGVAFLTERREISPLISRLRVRTSGNTDVEWDFDYDTGANKLTSSNVLLDVHRGATFGALSYALLDAPGRFFTSGVSSTVSSFDQLRLLVGYGQPTKPGLSVAGNVGLDLCPVRPAATATNSGTTATPTASCALLQYATLQASYNWNCCGLAMEYRKYELGAVRNEGVYRFNFTLANIGAAGNLRRAERLF